MEEHGNISLQFVGFMGRTFMISTKSLLASCLLIGAVHLLKPGLHLKHWKNVNQLRLMIGQLM